MDYKVKKQRNRKRKVAEAVAIYQPQVSAPTAAIPTDFRLRALINSYGNNRVAELLQVNRSQPSRWRTGEENIGSENQRKVIDLDYVMARLEQVYPRAVADIWLQSHNSHLGGRPVDVLHLRGAGPVIDAVDAAEQGAYA